MVDKADDAVALWQQMVGEMQKSLRDFGDQFSPAPRNSSDTTNAEFGTAQRQLADFMESYFASMNLPSRAQLNALADRLDAIEDALNDIKALLREARMSPEPTQAAPPVAAPTVPDAPVAASPVPRPRLKRPATPKPRSVPAGKGASSVPQDDDAAE